jgi:hypothetical protein
VETTRLARPKQNICQKNNYDLLEHLCTTSLDQQELKNMHTAQAMPKNLLILEREFLDLFHTASHLVDQAETMCELTFNLFRFYRYECINQKHVTHLVTKT